MVGWFQHLLNTDGFPPRWLCGVWTPAHGWTHIVSDLLIAGAYAAIPAVLAYFLIKRRDLPFPPVFVLFILFILACGITHLIDATLFWKPWYRLSAAAKAVTAVVSWATVIALIRVIPRALELPGLEQSNQALQQEIAEQRLAEERVRTVLEAAPNAMVMVDAAGRIVMINAQTERLFGYPRDELIGQPVEILMPEHVRARHPADRAAFFSQPRTRQMGAGRNLVGRRRDGTLVPIEIGLNPVQTDQGPFALASIIDISDRLHRDAQLQAALAQSEMLLREVHHRVKNNLQVVSSLLRLHATKLSDPEQRAVFENCRDRIQAMALIHERLYGRDHFARVDFGAYLSEISRIILRSNAPADTRIELELRTDPLALPLDTAVPLGLIASELLLNAVRHAFAGRAGGRLTVTLRAGEDRHELAVADDGPGLPDATERKPASGIGFALVDGLVGQIGGTRAFEARDRGLCVRIQWPAPPPEPAKAKGGAT